MAPIRESRGFVARLKVLLMCMVIFALISVSFRAFSQAGPPSGPPPPPPPPGELLKKINPFKKHKDTVNKKDTSKSKQSQVSRSAGGPPPPPSSPLDLFKKKKKDTTKKAPANGTGN